MRHAPKMETALTKEQIEAKRPAPPKGWKQSKKETQNKVHYKVVAKPDTENLLSDSGDKVGDFLSPILAPALKEYPISVKTTLSKLDSEEGGYVCKIELELLMDSEMTCRVFWAVYDTLKDIVAYSGSEFMNDYGIPHDLAKQVWKLVEDKQ